MHFCLAKLADGRPACSYQLPDGRGCRATPLKAEPFCFSHAPGTADELAEARRLAVASTGARSGRSPGSTASVDCAVSRTARHSSRRSRLRRSPWRTRSPQPGDQLDRRDRGEADRAWRPRRAGGRDRGGDPDTALRGRGRLPGRRSRMTLARRLAAVESALTPTQLVLRWLEEAHSFGASRHSSARSSPQSPSRHHWTSWLMRQPTGRGRASRASLATRSARRSIRPSARPSSASSSSYGSTWSATS